MCSNLFFYVQEYRFWLQTCEHTVLHTTRTRGANPLPFGTTAHTRPPHNTHSQCKNPSIWHDNTHSRAGIELTSIRSSFAPLRRDLCLQLINIRVDLCCLQWVIHTLWPLIMTDTILCVYACMFRVRMCVHRWVRVRGSARGVYTQCMCVYVVTTRICNNHTHTPRPALLPLCVRCLENCHSHFR